MRNTPPRLRAAAVTAALTLVGACLLPTSAQAAPVADPGTKASAASRSALGNGLGRLVPGAAATQRITGGLKIDQRALAIRDDAGRVLVDLTPQADADRGAFRTAAETAGLKITAVDDTRGTLEGFAAASAFERLASLPGAGTLVQVPKPTTSAGSVESQGVPYQRVDRVLKKGVDGRGITVGVLSDSYDAATTDPNGDPQTDRAATDVASGDLPGTGNPQNPQPVVVLEDLEPSEDATDEGRGMLQIIHDMAPAAKLCFATAFSGEVGFANNIRALADRTGPCRADVIVDDVGYFSEPFFSDGVIGDAVDDVAKQGVKYFSSAGNAGDQNGWGAKVRLVGPAAAERAGLDLGDVDPSLYDGGFQDVDPGSGTDVAQTLTLGGAGGLFDLQWNDPFDVNGAAYGDPYLTATGTVATGDQTVDVPFTPTADQVGKLVEFKVDGVPSGTVDLILTVTAPDGTVIADQVDTGASPESFDATLTQAGTYTIAVSTFGGDTGAFTATVRPVLAPSKVTTDFNVLFFDMDGNYVGGAADQNRFTGRPLELVPLPGAPRDLQVVIARSGTGSTPVTDLRVITNGDVQFTDRPNPFAVTTYGHPTAAGAIGVAAQSAFKPYQPEYFTSVGGKLPIYFDSAGKRYKKVQVRTKPEVAATDGVNTTFFYSDTVLDPDATPNFFGTSAAAPSAAGIAALVLQKRGGGSSVSPSAMRALLQRSTFAHDLDPFAASGTAKGLTVSATGAQGSERGYSAGTLDDDRFFTLQYRGSSRIRSVTFDGATAAPTALGPNGRSAGLVFDPRAFQDLPTKYQATGFPFTVGSASGLYASDVTASFAGRSGLAAEGQYRTMTLTFKGGLRKGDSIRFGVDRDLAQTAYGNASEGNSADLLGGGVVVPQRTAKAGGLRFTAVLTDGKKFSGVIANRLGSGFSPVDGYGLIDAEKAVLGR